MNIDKKIEDIYANLIKKPPVHDEKIGKKFSEIKRNYDILKEIDSAEELITFHCTLFRQILELLANFNYNENYKSKVSNFTEEYYQEIIDYIGKNSENKYCIFDKIKEENCGSDNCLCIGKRVIKSKKCYVYSKFKKCFSEPFLKKEDKCEKCVDCIFDVGKNLVQGMINNIGEGDKLKFLLIDFFIDPRNAKYEEKIYQLHGNLSSTVHSSQKLLPEVYGESSENTDIPHPIDGPNFDDVVEQMSAIIDSSSNPR